MLGAVFGAVVGAVVLAVALAARVARVRALRRRYEGAAVVADACPCAPLSWTLWRLLRAGLGDGVRFPRAATGVGADGPTPFVLDLGAAEAVVLPADKLPAPRALLPRRVADALVWRPPAAQPPSPPPPPAVYTPTATGTHATSRDAIACAGAPALLRANSTVALATLMCSATFVRALGHAAARTVSAWTRQHDVPLFDACQQYVVDALLAVFIGEQALAESCGAARARLARQVCRAARALRPSAWSACSPLRTCTRADAGERTHVRRIAALVAAVMRASGGPHAPSAYAEHAATIAASSSDTDASERPQTLAFAAMLLRACEDAARLTAWVVFQLLNTERNASMAWAEVQSIWGGPVQAAAISLDDMQEMRCVESIAQFCAHAYACPAQTYETSEPLEIGGCAIPAHSTILALDTTAPSGGLSPDALRTWSRKQRALRDEHDARETGAPRVRRAQQEMLVSPSTTPLAYSPVELRLFGSTALVEIIHRAIKVLVATLTSTADSFVALEKRGAEPRVLHVADGLARPRRSVVIAVEQR